MSITEAVDKIYKMYTSINNINQLSMAATYCYLLADYLKLDCDAKNVFVAYKSQLYNDAIRRITK